MSIPEFRDGCGHICAFHAQDLLGYPDKPLDSNGNEITLQEWKEDLARDYDWCFFGAIDGEHVSCNTFRCQQCFGNGCSCGGKAIHEYDYRFGDRGGVEYLSLK